MKARIILFVTTLLAWLWVSSAFLSPAATVIENKVSVSTLNGGDAAFIANEALSKTAAYPWLTIGVIVILVIFWAGPVVRLLKSPVTVKAK